jgi:hypothetical protein
VGRLALYASGGLPRNVHERGAPDNVLQRLIRLGLVRYYTPVGSRRALDGGSDMVQMLNLAKRHWKVRIVVLAFALIGATYVGLERSHSMQYRSREEITRLLLEGTPRGTTRDVVRGFVHSNGWRRGGVVRNTGGPNEESVDRISVYLGQAPGITGHENVYAEWIFDAEDNLVDVQVYKVTLGP